MSMRAMPAMHAIPMELVIKEINAWKKQNLITHSQKSVTPHSNFGRTLFYYQRSPLNNGYDC